MPIALLLTSEVLDVHYDEDNAWLYLDWKGPQELKLVQATSQPLLEFIKQTGASKALNDNTHITETSWELARWVAQDFLPQVDEAGLEYIAWVSSPLLSCRGNVEMMSTLGDLKLQVAIFDEVAAAYSWLSSVNVPAATSIAGPSGQ